MVSSFRLPAVVDFVALLPRRIITFDKISKGRLQLAQQQSLITIKFHHLSPASDLVSTFPTVSIL